MLQEFVLVLFFAHLSLASCFIFILFSYSSTEPLFLMDPALPIKIKPDPDAMLSTSAPSSCQSAPSLMRTNFKLQLQKEHLLQLEKKEQANKEKLAQSQTWKVPSGKASPLNNTIPSDVPPNILKVFIIYLEHACLIDRQSQLWI